MVLRLPHLIATTVIFIAVIGRGVSPMSIFAMAQESELPSCVGSDVAIWHDCQGNLQYQTGVYVGDFHNGQPNGHGTLTLPNGAKYVGEFKDGKRNGRGTSLLPDGSKYVGEVKDDLPYGHGTFTLPNGQKYVGIFRGVQIIGGTVTFPDGKKYVGEFKDSKFNGHGTLTYLNGEKYIGEFKDDKRDGHGPLYAADRSISSSGIWADDEYVGTAAGQESVAMEKEAGVYVVPVRLNGAITLNAIIDSGAADVSIPSDVVSTLIRTKTISEEDFLGIQTYVLADGSKVPSARFRIRSLKVGNKTIENVPASIASGKADILLGQSFLSRFKSWSIDNDRHELILRLP
jgi:clan AA aspartic protease (TIGR02281 family)